RRPPPATGLREARRSRRLVRTSGPLRGRMEHAAPTLSSSRTRGPDEQLRRYLRTQRQALALNNRPGSVSGLVIRPRPTNVPRHRKHRRRTPDRRVPPGPPLTSASRSPFGTHEGPTSRVILAATTLFHWPRTPNKPKPRAERGLSKSELPIEVSVLPAVPAPGTLQRHRGARRSNRPVSAAAAPASAREVQARCASGCRWDQPERGPQPKGRRQCAGRSGRASTATVPGVQEP